MVSELHGAYLQLKRFRSPKARRSYHLESGKNKGRGNARFCKKKAGQLARRFEIRTSGKGLPSNVPVNRSSSMTFRFPIGLIAPACLFSERSCQSDTLLKLRSGCREELPCRVEQRLRLCHLTSDLNDSILGCSGRIDHDAVFEDGVC